MRKLKQATQREKARRALKDKQAAEPIAAQPEPHQAQQRLILYKSIGAAGSDDEQGQRRNAPARKVTHH
jgi:hypothetical protein